MTEEEHRQRRSVANKRYYNKNREKEQERSRKKLKKRREQDPEGYRKYLRSYRKKNPDKIRFWWLKHKYDLTREQFESMLKAQGGGCAICKKPGKLVVDHDHVTKHVRGLLCSKHNTGIGQFDDDVQELLKAISYLTGNSK